MIRLPIRMYSLTVGSATVAVQVAAALVRPALSVNGDALCKATV
jgi:hypothetical protein